MAFRVFVPIPSIVNLHGGKLKCSAECCPQLLRYFKNREENQFNTNSESEINHKNENECVNGFYIRNFISHTNLLDTDSNTLMEAKKNETDSYKNIYVTPTTKSSGIKLKDSKSRKYLKRLRHENRIPQYFQSSNQNPYWNGKFVQQSFLIPKDQSFSIKYSNRPNWHSDTNSKYNQRNFSSTSARRCDNSQNTESNELDDCNQLIDEHKKANPDYVNTSKQVLESGSQEERKAVEEAVNFATQYKEEIHKIQPYSPDNSKSGFDRVKYQFVTDLNDSGNEYFDKKHSKKSTGYKRMIVPWPSYSDKLRRNTLKPDRDQSSEDSINSSTLQKLINNKSNRRYSTDSRNTFKSDFQSDFTINECLFDLKSEKSSLSTSQSSNLNSIDSSLYLRLRQSHQSQLKADQSFNRNFHKSYRLREEYQPECPPVKPRPIKDVAPLKRLKKVKMKQTSRAEDCPIPKEEPCIRADDGVPTTFKKLPSLSAGKCPPVQIKTQYKDVPLKRLPKPTNMEPTLAYTCPKPPPCKRADDDLKMKQKYLPVLKVLNCPPVEIKPLPQNPLKRLPNVEIKDPPNICPKVSDCTTKRADDNLKKKSKSLPNLKAGKCKVVHQAPLKEGAPLARLKRVDIVDPPRICPSDENICAPRADDGLPPKELKSLPTMILKEQNNTMSLREYNAKHKKKIGEKAGSSPFKKQSGSKRNFFTYNVEHLKHIRYFPLYDTSFKIRELTSLSNIERSLSNLCETLNYFRDKFLTRRKPKADFKHLLLKERFDKLHNMKESNVDFETWDVFPKWSAIDAIVKLEVPSRTEFMEKTLGQRLRHSSASCFDRKGSIYDYQQERLKSTCPPNPCAKKDPCENLDPCPKPDPCKKPDPCEDPCPKPDPCAPKKCKAKKGLLRRIISYFRARPGCPTYAEIRQRELVEKAEAAAKAAGLKICYCSNKSPCKTPRVQAMEDLCSPKPDYSKIKPPAWDPNKCKNLKKKKDDDCDYMKSVEDVQMQELNKDESVALLERDGDEVDMEQEDENNKYNLEIPYPTVTELSQNTLDITQHTKVKKPNPLIMRSTASTPYHIGSKTLFKRRYSTFKCFDTLDKLSHDDLFDVFEQNTTYISDLSKHKCEKKSKACVCVEKNEIEDNTETVKVCERFRNFSSEIYDLQRLSITNINKERATTDALNEELHLISNKLSKMKII